MTVQRSTQPPLGPGRTVWLASYPKSGNTWMRAIVTALGTYHPQLFGVNHLGSGSQPMHVGASLAALGIDARWLSRDEVDQLRTVLIRRWGERVDGLEPENLDERLRPVLRKTHEVYRPGVPGREPFPTSATRAAILVVRDPRDVVCSYGPFFGVDIDTSVDAVGREHAPELASPVNSTTAQPWGSWSTHTASWLDPAVPFPVHLVRYEDLQVDAVTTLAPVFEAIGLACTKEELTAAVELTRFDRLRQSEKEVGFRETSRKTRTFFRKGRAQAWRDELSADQVAAVEADHSEWMQRLAYELTTEQAPRKALAQSRSSRRRQESADPFTLPDWLGIAIRQGEIPEELPGARRPRRWIQVTDDEALVNMSGGAGVYVRNGNEAVVNWSTDPTSPDEDPSWLVQGWVVTLAMLQRGDLSLHASTVAMGDQTVALAGNRGAGKSTTSLGLRQRGHTLLIDDVTLIEFRPDGAWTTPYSRNVHLLPDAAAALGVDFDALRPLAGGRIKAGFRPEDPPETPRRIDRIIVLAPDDDAETPSLREARGIERIQALQSHTVRDGMAPMVLGHDRYFRLLTELADSTPIHVLRRPRTGWTLDQVLDLIEASTQE